MGGMQRYESASVYHTLPKAYEEDRVCCWHCCEEITDKRTLIPLPRLYDTSEKVFHVYGATCSPSCAKAYILEHTSFDRGQHLNVLVKMLREVYDVNDVVAAPPRASLRRFGGLFDPTSFKKVECSIVQPPFVSYCMLVQEHLTDNGTTMVPMDKVEDADTFDEPPPPALYTQFLEERPVEDSTVSDAPAPVKRKRKVSTTATSGPMAKFIKPQVDE